MLVIEQLDKGSGNAFAGKDSFSFDKSIVVYDGRELLGAQFTRYPVMFVLQTVQYMDFFKAQWHGLPAYH